MTEEKGEAKLHIVVVVVVPAPLDSFTTDGRHQGVLLC